MNEKPTNSANDSHEALLTTGETAQLLGISPRTLEGWRYSRTGPRFVRLSQKCIRYKADDVHDWLSQRLHNGTIEYDAKLRLR